MLESKQPTAPAKTAVIRLMVLFCLGISSCLLCMKSCHAEVSAKPLRRPQESRWQPMGPFHSSYGNSTPRRSNSTLLYLHSTDAVAVDHGMQKGDMAKSKAGSVIPASYTQPKMSSHLAMLRPHT
ncbi:hypothetical protein P7K49_012317 [Saguinus oedipus]|uniref:Uncharacterized protein n=1 Tax=Saguinus oedipus TaxID=9490 RepID=A0ABQ9VTR3_SAGOE|nr:hypothetical protein P7K49_012317 [Saguinus oedipus]